MTDPMAAAPANPALQNNPVYQAFIRQLGQDPANQRATPAAPPPNLDPTHGWNMTPAANPGLLPQAAAAKPGLPAPQPAAGAGDPSLLADPTYAAFLRSTQAEKTTASASTQAQEEAIARQLAERRAQLAQQNTEAIGGINNSMESRGLFRSGENVSNQTKQQSAYGQADAAAISAAADQQAALRQALSDRLAGIDRNAAEQALTAGQNLALQDAVSRIGAGGAAAQIPGQPSTGVTIGGTSSPPVVNSAMSWVGEPYQWGGGHGAVGGAKSTKVDCSGLVQQVFGENGIKITGTAADMQKKGTPVPSIAQAQPGDLVFWGSPAHHVGIYIGNGQMIDAPHTGANVRIEPVDGFGKDFAGIRRIV